MRWPLNAVLTIACLLLAGCAGASPPTAAFRSETILSDGYGPECHASNLVKLPDGSLAAAWFSGTKEGADDVVIRFTRQRPGSREWTRPTTIAAHPGVPCWNPVLFVSADGSLTLFYKAAKRIPDWEGWFRRSVDGGQHWSAAQRLPKGFLGPIRCHGLARPDGSVLFGSSTEAATGTKPWRVHFERCTQPGDWADGAHWSRHTPGDDSPPLNAIQPALLDFGAGRLVAYARTREGVVARTESSDDGRSWSPLRPAQPRQANPNAGLDALRLPAGQTMLVLNPGQNRLQLDAVLLAADGQAWTTLVRIDAVAKGEVSYPSALLDSEDGVAVLRVSYTRNRREIVLRTFTLDGQAR